MRKKHLKYISYILFLTGIFFLTNPNLNITGAVIGSELNISSIFSFILGLVFVIGGIGVLSAGKEGGGLEERAREDYYKKRAKEIFNPHFHRQDVWVSRWELDGIMNYIKNAKDGKGNPKYWKVDFEHGTDTPGIHPIGRYYKIPHINAYLETKSPETGKKEKIRRHFLITNDPSESRLKNIGIKGEEGQRGEIIKSKVYRPNHPIYPNQVYKRGTHVTYKLDEIEDNQEKR